MANELQFTHGKLDMAAPMSAKVEGPQGANPLTNLAYGIGYGAAGTVLQGGVNYLLSEHAYKRQKDLMREEFRLNEKSQKRRVESSGLVRLAHITHQLLLRLFI